MLKSNRTIRIHKAAGQKKDAVRITTAQDIPEFLSKTISVVGDSIVMENVEAGKESCPIGNVIGYEESDRTPSGYNCWCISNAATNLVEIDGVFYKKATVFDAIRIPEKDQQPDWMKEFNITYNGDGTISYQCPWALVSGKIGVDFFIMYGPGDANILSVTEKSFRDYIVTDDDGNDIGYLYELAK